MRINGVSIPRGLDEKDYKRLAKAFAEGHTSSHEHTASLILENLSALPSAFTERTIEPFEAPDMDEQSQPYLLDLQAFEAFTRFKETGAEEDLQQAHALLHSSIDLSLKVGDVDIAAADCNNLAHVLEAGGRNIEALTYRSQAVALYEQLQQFDAAYNSAGALYLLQASLQEEGLHSVTEDTLKETRQKLFFFNKLQQGALNEQAYRVEQGQVGFSDAQPIGTDNVCDCIAMVVRDPVSHKTALAHIDYHTAPDSLESLFRHLPDTELEITLLGANSQDSYSLAQDNLSHVLHFLSHKDNVNILRADIFDAGQPHALTVDPKTGKITEHVPGIFHEDVIISTGEALLEKGHRPIEICFDLTQSDTRITPFLESGQIHRMRTHFGNKTTAQIIKRFPPGEDDPYDVLSWAEMALNLVAAHNDAYNDISSAYRAAVEQKRAAGVQIDEGDITRTLQLLETCEKHIGSNAEHANMPLKIFLQEALIDDKGTHDFAALQRFHFGGTPFERLKNTQGEKSWTEGLERKTPLDNALRQHDEKRQR